MMILHIPSLVTNEEDQQIIIHVAMHENACFSKRAAVAFVDITDVFASVAPPGKNIGGAK